MTDQEFEQTLQRVLSCDFSVDSEAFRDDLLQRCLSALTFAEDSSTLSDEDLELIAAAGEQQLTPTSFPHGANPLDQA